MHVHNKRLTTFYVFLELTIVTHKSINVSDFFEKEIRILRKIQKISTISIKRPEDKCLVNSNDDV